MTGAPTLQLVYHSRRSPGTTDRIVAEDIALLAAAKNRLMDVAGCLWFGPARFAQVLEGAPRVVDELFESIRRDFRHFDVCCCGRAPVRQRAHDTWTLRAMEGDEHATVAAILTRYGVAPPAPAHRTAARRIADLFAPHAATIPGDLDGPR